MAQDALDPVDGSYPAFPRRPDGSPAWSDAAETDGIPVPGRGPGGVVTPMPRGIRYLIRGSRRERIAVDVTPRNGTDPVNPPVLP
jgi:hypothetical protein